MPTYELDATGAQSDHAYTETFDLVKGKRIRAVSPSKGVFFSDSVKIINLANATELNKGVDYVFMEKYESLSLKFGKPLYGIIAIINENLEGQFELKYQLLGDVYETQLTEVSNYVNSKDKQILSIPNWIKVNTSVAFLPDDNQITISKQNITFEYICYGLEKLRMAVLKSDEQGYRHALEHLRNFTGSYMSLIESELPAATKALLAEIHDDLTQHSAGLGNLRNFPVATTDEGRSYADANYSHTGREQRYIASKALSGYKQALYETFISSQLTGIDRIQGVTALPTIATLLSMTNGSRYVIDSIENMKTASVAYDEAVYPETKSTKAKWIIYKLSNNERDRGGMLIASNILTGSIWLGTLTWSEHQAHELKWLGIFTQKDAGYYIDALHEHITNRNNPHCVTKFQVGLGEVENLPIATMNEILCRKPIKAYITHDALKFFFTNFMKDANPLGEKEDPEAKVKLADRIRMIFAPCGPCGQPLPPRSSGSGAVDANTKGALVGTYCESGTLYGRYSDGAGKTYVGILEANYPDCNTTGVKQYVEIKNNSGVILGRGYSAKNLFKDPDATVSLARPDGSVLCYMFPEPKERTTDGRKATVLLTDKHGAQLGYLMEI